MTENVDQNPVELQTERYRFVGVCSHCGKPIHINLDSYKVTGPGQMERRDPIQVWIDPEHACTYLKIEKAEVANEQQ